MGGELVKVLIVDDHEVFGQSLARALADEPDIEVVATVISIAAALEAMSTGVDVVLSDFRLGDGDGIDLTKTILGRWPAARIVMLTASDDDAVLARALEAGCSGFVTKAESLGVVLAAVRSAALGEAVITPSLLARLLPRLKPGQRGRNPDLTDRELEVLGHIVTGASNREIADRLVLSRDTVRNHVASILSKLGVHSKLQAAAEATRRGIVTRPRA